MLLSSVLAMAQLDLRNGNDLGFDGSGGVLNTNAPADALARATPVTRRTSDAGTKRELPDTGNGDWKAHATDDPPRGTYCAREYPAALRAESTTELNAGRVAGAWFEAGAMRTIVSVHHPGLCVRTRTYASSPARRTAGDAGRGPL